MLCGTDVWIKAQPSGSDLTTFCIEIKVNTTSPRDDGRHDHKNCNKAYKDAMGAAHAQRKASGHGSIRNTLIHLDLIRDVHGNAPTGREHIAWHNALADDDIRVQTLTQIPRDGEFPALLDWVLAID